MRPEALAALAGSRHIIHAGDVGDPDVLEQLSRIAPVTAVRGNNDRGRSFSRLKETETLKFGEIAILAIHDVAALRGEPEADVVVAGHSHRPREERRGRVLYVNPGSAGPRRFKLPVAVARLLVSGKRVRFQLVPL